MNEQRLEKSILASLASQKNEQTRGLTTYAGHRDATMQLIASMNARLSQSGEHSIAILGAGNCMDLDLAALQSRFQTIHLLDVDRAAVEFGVQSQLPIHATAGEADRSSFNLIAPIDLASPLADLEIQSIADPEHAALMRTRLAAPFDDLTIVPVDVVLSTCVLSQIIGGLLRLVPEDHPQFLPMLQSIRLGHFRRMLQLLKPGGQGIFVSDLVSSESTPELATVTETQLPKLLAHCIADRNFFSGLNPGVILQELVSEEALRRQSSNVRIHPPWRWLMGPRIYAVFAVTFERTQS